MARKAPTQALTTIELNHEALAESAQALDAATKIESQGDANNDKILAAGIDIGRLEALDFMATVANSTALSIFENVKKSKTWALLKNREKGDGRLFESLEQFCEVKLGKSYRRLNELSANRKLLGHDAYDKAEKIGLRQVDYNALKSLPAPAQELVRRAVEETKTREEVVDLLQELAAQQGELAKHADELSAKVQDKDRMLEAKNKKIDEMDEELTRKFKPKAHSIAKSAEEAAFLNGLNEHVNGAEVHFARLGVVVAELMESGPREAIRERAQQTIQYLVTRMREIVLENQLEVNVESDALGGRPEWLNAIN